MAPELASSFHLWWRLPTQEPLVQATAVCEVLVAPSVDHLYFWAMQVGFHDGNGGRGGAHVGLQWHGRAPHRRAVNWGGYRDATDGGGEFAGSASRLVPLNPSGNTLRYPWEPLRPYRFHVSRAQEGWRAEVTDVQSGETSVIRDLYAPGRYLSDPVVWSEVFAYCHDPSVTVRWSGLEAMTASGSMVKPDATTVTYQSEEDGGCENTSVSVDDVGLLQITNAQRTTPPGTVISLD